MTDIKRLKEGLKINEHSLDTALRDHPDLFYAVSMELALAISNRDEAKQNLEEVEAQVDIEIRSECERLKEKTTEKEIESLKKVDPKVKSANDKFLAEKLNAANLTALKDAYESRSYALSKLVDLYLANYYSQQEDKKTGAPELRNARAQVVKETNARARVRV